MRSCGGHFTLVSRCSEASSSGARKRSRATTMVPVPTSRPSTGSARSPSSASSRNAPTASASGGQRREARLAGHQHEDGRQREAEGGEHQQVELAEGQAPALPLARRSSPSAHQRAAQREHHQRAPGEDAEAELADQVLELLRRRAAAGRPAQQQRVLPGDVGLGQGQRSAPAAPSRPEHQHHEAGAAGRAGCGRSCCSAGTSGPTPGAVSAGRLGHRRRPGVRPQATATVPARPARAARAPSSAPPDSVPDQHARRRRRPDRSQRRRPSAGQAKRPRPPSDSARPATSGMSEVSWRACRKNSGMVPSASVGQQRRPPAEQPGARPVHRQQRQHREERRCTDARAQLADAEQLHAQRGQEQIERRLACRSGRRR